MTRHRQEFPGSRPYRSFPWPVAVMAGTAALGLFRSSTGPVRNRPRTSRRGKVEHNPVATSLASARPPRLAHSLRATSCRNALCTPGRRCPHGPGDSLSSPAASQRRVPVTRQYNPAQDVGVTRHQRGFPDSRPSGPSPDLWPPWLEQRPSGFPVSSAPGRSGRPRTSRRDGSDTEPQLRLGIGRTSTAHSPRATCVATPIACSSRAAVSR